MSWEKGMTRCADEALELSVANAKEVIARRDARIEELEGLNEALRSDVHRLREKNKTFSAAWDELAALKSQQPTGVVLPERRSRSTSDWVDLDRTNLAGDAHSAGWNAALYEVARLNPCQVSAEDTSRVSGHAWGCRAVDDYKPGDCNCDFGSAGGVDERAAVGAHECTCPNMRGAGKPGLCPIHDASYIEKQSARAALSAGSAVQHHSEQVRHMVPDGWVMVPVKPTPAMLDELTNGLSAKSKLMKLRYAAMLAAAPSAQQEKGDE